MANFIIAKDFGEFTNIIDIEDSQEGSEVMGIEEEGMDQMNLSIGFPNYHVEEQPSLYFENIDMIDSRSNRRRLSSSRGGMQRDHHHHDQPHHQFEGLQLKGMDLRAVDGDAIGEIDQMDMESEDMMSDANRDTSDSGDADSSDEDNVSLTDLSVLLPFSPY